MFCRDLFVLLLLLPLSLMAQEPAYLHYGVQDGLPGNLVYCGLQDRNGLLWFGTDKGLACFDGTRFHNFGMADGLPDPEVLNLVEDNHNRLWISCFRKKPCYRMNSRIVNSKSDTLLDKVDFEIGMADFSQDNNAVWITGLERDFYRYDNKGMHTVILDGSAARFGRIGRKSFIFSTNEIAEYKSDNDLPIVFRFNHNLGRGLPFVGFSISGNLVLYSWSDRLILLEWQLDRFVQLDVLMGVSGRVFTDSEGDFWVCSLNDGALNFSKKPKNLKNPQRFLVGKKTTAMFEDNQRTRWFCTLGQGIYALTDNPAIQYTQLTETYSSNITALFSDKNGKVYVGDDVGNIHFIDPAKQVTRTNHLQTLDGYSRCRQIIGTEDGSIWYGTDEGLFREKDGRFNYWSVVTTGIKGILHQNNLIWFATFSKLGYFKVNEKEFNLLSSRRYTCIGEDSEGGVWAGGIDGLFSKADGFGYNWGESYTPLLNRISGIHKANEPYLWVSNPEHGLLRLKVHEGKVQGLEIINDSLSVAIHNIQSMYWDKEERLWLSTNQGVFRIDHDLNVVRYDHRDGLANDDVNAVTITGDTLWVGTVDGLTRIKMMPFTEESNFRTILASMRYQQGDKEVNHLMLDALALPDTLIQLPCDANLVAVELAGLDFRSSGGLRFICVLTERLAPLANLTLDNLSGWMFNGFKPVSQSRTIASGTFDFGIKLPPGRYVLEATAINSRGVESNQPVRLELIMPAYWYETIWFWLSVWSLLGLVIYKTVGAQMAIHRLRASISGLQLQTLQSQINPHFIGNAINSIQQFFYPPNPAKASEYVSLLTRLLRRTLEFSEHAFIAFGDEIAYDTDYLELNRLRFGDHLVYTVEGANLIDPQTPFPSMLLQPLLENATIHGIAPDGNTVLNLHFEQLGKKLVCTLTDNGIGIHAMQQRPTEHGRVSKGLQMLHKKAETINQLYRVNMTLQIIDLSESNIAGSHGTRVVLAYEPEKMQSIRSRTIKGLLQRSFKFYRP